MRKFLLVALCLASFVTYHSNSGRGPDSGVYMRVAHRIITAGHLNIVPEHLDPGSRWQITATNHAPIHQNVGGVLFIVPATVAAYASVSAASWFPSLPQSLYDINYHEKLWLGSIVYLLAAGFCFFSYRVGCRYASPRAVIASLAACFFGGPLLVYTSVFPCQMSLPVAFIAAFMLYVYHQARLEQKRVWLLLGALWGLGVFVRSEFAVWGLFILYGLAALRRPGEGWRPVLVKALLAGCGGLLFLIPAAMIRGVVFGTAGSTYGVQFDPAILTHSYLMLFGWRNGLFTFWPVLALALPGYLLNLRRNPPLFHVLAAILLFTAVICGTTNFWSGELGNSFGQRRFLVVLPCFVLFLARLFDLGRRFFWLLVAACVAGSLWAMALCCVYGEVWSFADGRLGFLMPYHLYRVIQVLSDCAPRLPAKIAALALLPKHADMLWLAPLAAVGGAVMFPLARLGRRYATELCLGMVVCSSCAAIVFLAGARQRGEAAFSAIARANPGAEFIVRKYEIDNEIVGSMVDAVSFFLEVGQEGTAQYFADQGVRFLQVEAPDQVDPFRKMVDALLWRQSLGWYRLVPEQSHTGLLEWYRQALAAREEGMAPPDISGAFLY